MDYNLLLIEDDEIDRKTIFNYLKKKSDSNNIFNLRSTTTLSAGLDLLDKESIDLILVDLGLPDTLDPLDTVQKVTLNCNGVPAIVLSGCKDITIARECFKHGIYDFLVKGHFDAFTLQRSIDLGIERKNLSQKVENQSDEIEHLATFAQNCPFPCVEFDKTTQKMTFQNLVFNEYFSNRDIKDLEVVFQKHIWNYTSPENFEANIEERYFYCHVSEFDRWIRLFMYDITERKKMELWKEEFISLVSHEIRTPLSLMQGALENLAAIKSLELPKEILEMYNILEHGNERLIRIANNILELTRVKSGKLELKFSLIDINTSLKEMLKNIHVSNTQIVLTHNFSDNLPPVYADLELIWEVVNNLISNAYKHARSKITLHTHQTKDDILVTIEDDGHGISKQDLPRVFGQFVQLKREIGAGYKGSGLGLTICKEIIELHHGKIWVESIVDQGTKFIFSLPLLQAPNLAPTQEFQGKKILVIDDEIDFAKTLQYALQKQGSIVKIAENGHEGLEIMKEFVPDCIILDMLMPRMDGLAFLEFKNSLRSDLRMIPVLILTALSQSEEINRKALNKGALNILYKPYQQKELFKKLGAILNQ